MGKLRKMRWNTRYVFVSHAMAGDAVGLEPVGEALWRVWFHFYEAGIFHESTLRLRRPSPSPSAKDIL